jgi:hypothetical protein
MSPNESNRATGPDCRSRTSEVQQTGGSKHPSAYQTRPLRDLTQASPTEHQVLDDGNCKCDGETMAAEYFEASVTHRSSNTCY